MKTKDIGDFYEGKAEAYLLESGYSVLEKNYRYKRNEIDIICKKDEILVFVEVKYRKNSYFGYPEGFVNEAKLLRLQEAAEDYLIKTKWEGRIRFDVVALDKKGIEHFKDIS